MFHLFLFSLIIVVLAISEIISALIVLLFLVPLKTNLVFDTNKSKLQLTALWLHPFITALVTLENSTPVLNLSIFGKHVLKKKVIKKTGISLNFEYMRILRPQNIQLSIRYGFCDPFDTGITCGAVNMVSQLINISFFENNPDFLADNDYIYLNASAKVFMGQALIRIIRQKLFRRDLQWMLT